MIKILEDLKIMKENNEKYYSICPNCNYKDNIEATKCPNCDEKLIPCDKYINDMYILETAKSNIPRYVLFLNIHTKVLGLADYGHLTTKAPSPTAVIQYVTKAFFDYLCNKYKNVLIHDDTPNKPGPGGIEFNRLTNIDKRAINKIFGSSI